MTNSDMQVMLQTMVALDRINNRAAHLLLECIDHVPLSTALKITEHCKEGIHALDNILGLMERAGK